MVENKVTDSTYISYYLTTLKFELAHIVMAGPDQRNYKEETHVANTSNEPPKTIHVMTDVEHPAVRIQLVSTWKYQGIIPYYTAVLGKRTLDLVPIGGFDL